MTEVIKGVKLLVEEGRKKEDGTRAEPVAFYGARRGRSCIVFLPKSAVVGKTVRVDLLELEKKDARGAAMYRATPVAAEVSERWREESDGSLTLFKVSTDWLGDEREVETLKPRPKRRRESETGTRSEFVPIWGSDLAASYVEERSLKVFETHEEEVVDGKLANRKVSERTEPQQTTSHPIAELKHEDLYMGDWCTKRLEPAWSALKVQLNFFAVLPDRKVGCTWVGLYPSAPAFWRAAVEAHYPVCQCGRQRRDAQMPGFFGKCELCRQEAHCTRCGKQARVVDRLDDLCCGTCQVYAEIEEKLQASLSAEHLATIAAEAKRLRASETYPKSDGEALLRALTTHFASTAAKDNFVQRCANREWHYWTTEGVFGSQFSPTALLLLEYLPQAEKNSFVDMVCWIIGHHSSTRGGGNWFIATQIEGREDVHPVIRDNSLRELNEKLEAGKPVLADFLRGNEQDRNAALEAKQWLTAQQLLDSEAWQTLRHIENVLDESQDYASALMVLAEYKRGWERRRAKAAVEAERERVREIERPRQQEWLDEEDRPHFALTTPPPTPRDEYLARWRELEAQHRHQHFGVYGPFARTVRPSKKDPKRLVWSYIDKDGNILDADPASRLMVEAKTTYLGWISGNVPISAKEKATQIRLEMKVELDFEAKK